MRIFEGLFRKTPKPAIEQPSVEPQPPVTATSAKSEMNRRQFLEKAAKGAAGVAIAGWAAEPWISSALESSATKADHVTNDEMTADQSMAVEAGHEADFDTLNRDTAIPVAIGFIGFVGNAARGGSLGPVSIVTMSALEANRLSRLYQRGGEHGQHLAGEELHENVIAGALALGLAGISDLTTSAVKFEAEKLLEVTHQMEEHDAEHVMKRPAEDAPVERWEAYCEQIENELADQVTRTIAVSGVIAPFSTTYTSSVVANQMKGSTARLVFEHNFARNTVDRKRAKQESTVDQIEAVAQQRTNELMKQFTDLMTALSANIQGGVLAGDPPQFFGLADQWGNWGRLAKAEAVGLVNDVAMTAGLTAMWFKQAGITEPKVIQRLAEHTAELGRQAGGLLPAELTQLAPASASSEDVGLAFAGVELSSDAAADRIAKGRLRDAVSYRATFSFQGYIEKKARWLGRLPGIEQVMRMMEGRNDNKPTDTVSPLDQLRAFLVEGKVMSLQAGEVDPELDGLLQGLSAQIEQYAAQDVAAEREHAAIPDTADRATVAELHDRLADSASVETNRVQAIEDILLELGLEPEAIAHMDESRMRQEIVAILRTESTKNPGRVAELAAQFGVLDKTTAAPAAAEHTGHHDTHFFNHTGMEVRDALLTQLPAVGAAAALAEQSLSKVFSLQGGPERSSVAKVTAACAAALTSEAVISSLADNVAAYKYGYKVLCTTVEKVYGDASQKKFGKKVLDAFPGLHDAIFAIALKLAEQAGALTKLGNGPNFSQEELVLMKPAEATAYVAGLSAEARTKVTVEPQPVGSLQLVRRPLPFKIYDNHYANVANAALLTMAVGYLGVQLAQVESSLNQAAA